MIMAPQLSVEQRQIIVDLRKEGHGIKEIERRTGVSRATVRLWIRRDSEGGDLRGYHRVAYQRATTAEQDAAIFAAHREQPYLDTRSIASKLQISQETVRRRLKEAGLKHGVSGSSAQYNTLKMHCIQEKDSLTDNYEKDPLDCSDDIQIDEPESKQPRLQTSTGLEIFQIPEFNIPKSLTIIPSHPSHQLPKFVNNPLNLANPLALAAANGLSNLNTTLKRYSLPSKLSITPVKSFIQPRNSIDAVGAVRYKKNGEIAKKRGPPKGYKRKPKVKPDTSLTINKLPTIQTVSNGVTQQQTTVFTTGSLTISVATPASIPSLPRPAQPPPPPPPVPKVFVPKGYEPVQIDCDPADWFPDEPYKMVFSRKKNPKWKEFPYRCEHCFKGYRVQSTLLSHCLETHGAPPSMLAVPCPCCPHVSIKKKHHKQHLLTHEGKRKRIFCPYCIPPADPNEPFEKETTKYPFEKYPQFWYASEESLRLHKKRKHPYSALYNKNWRGTWGAPS